MDKAELQLRIGPQGTLVDGFLGPGRAVRVRTEIGRRFADHELHLRDLNFALGCLDALASEADPVRRQALWESAIVHFVKCFSRDIRFVLVAEEIWSDDPEGLKGFRFFRDLRNKHVIHDENSYADCATCVVLPDRRDLPRASVVFSFFAKFEVLDSEHMTRLRALIERTRSWADARKDTLVEELMEELEGQSDEALERLEPFVVPKLGGEVHARRVR
ncbi:MAG TPA: hypothetical protein VGR87_11490 [Candidatus Limnocylindria bacterium]|jgi:hypothetical protein|nr:hypothetical protein [Candidatus Limnocylindria bacterium]